ncbi:MAG: hypothetical protein N3E40_03265, partial [Dehalococcoidia bacterium]|nr:hypothetical protein [Dehalococcoidia bacterium]
PWAPLTIIEAPSPISATASSKLGTTLLIGILHQLAKHQNISYRASTQHRRYLPTPTALASQEELHQLDRGAALTDQSVNKPSDTLL